MVQGHQSVPPFTAPVPLMVVSHTLDDYPIFSKVQPTSTFLDALRSDEKPESAVCHFCNRTHVVEGCNNHMRCETLFEHSLSYLSVGFLDRKLFVFGCPCNAAAHYEIVFWNNRHLFIQYLKMKEAGEVQMAAADPQASLTQA
jgi:hypothetical protein